jgi:hypothetical protein
VLEHVRELNKKVKASEKVQGQASKTVAKSLGWRLWRIIKAGSERIFVGMWQPLTTVGEPAGTSLWKRWFKWAPGEDSCSSRMVQPRRTMAQVITAVKPAYPPFREWCAERGADVSKVAHASPSEREADESMPIFDDADATPALTVPAPGFSFRAPSTAFNEWVKEHRSPADPVRVSEMLRFVFGGGAAALEGEGKKSLMDLYNDGAKLSEPLVAPSTPE